MTVWGIVKNEAPILSRMVRSCAGFADEIVLVDTGSTDKTIEVANHLGCTVHVRDWVDFGTARTEAMALARTAAAGRGWLMLMDADFTMSCNAEFVPWLESCEGLDGLNVEIHGGGTTHRLPLLTRASAPAYYVGACHEVMTCDEPMPVQDVVGIAVTHHADGGTRDGDRLGFYEKCLRPAAEAGDPRSTYYMGQTMSSGHRIPEAIEWYQRRAEMTDGWEEERWHASYLAAWFAEDVEALLLCWTTRPDRHEPLTAAARLVGRAGTKDVLFLEAPPG